MCRSLEVQRQTRRCVLYFVRSTPAPWRIRFEKRMANGHPTNTTASWHPNWLSLSLILDFPDISPLLQKVFSCSASQEHNFTPTNSVQQSLRATAN